MSDITPKYSLLRTLFTILLCCCTFSITIANHYYDSMLKEAGILRKKADFIGANRLLLAALEHPAVQRDPEMLDNIYSHLAMNYWNLGYYEDCLKYNTKTFELVKEKGSPKRLGILLNNLGLAYWKIGNFKLAKESYNESLQYAIEIKNDTLTGLLYNNTGLLYMDNDIFDTARSYFHRSAIIFEANGFLVNLANAYNNLGNTYREQNQLDSGLFYFVKAEAIRNSIDDKDGLAASNYNIGSIYNLRKQYPEAVTFARKSLQISTDMKSLPRIREALSMIADIFNNQRQYDSAYKYSQAYALLQDSIYSVDKATHLAYFQALTDSEMKGLRISNLEKEKQISRLRIYYGLSLGGILLIAIAFFIQRRMLIYRKEKQITLLQLSNVQEILDIKERELKEHLFTLARKNKIIESLKEQASIVPEPGPAATVHNAEELVHIRVLTDDDWTDFKEKFAKVHNGFFTALKLTDIPFTEGDTRLLSFMKLNLNAKEIADGLGISHQSVRAAKVRLKKKLNSHGYKSIEDFIAAI